MTDFKPIPYSPELEAEKFSHYFDHEPRPLSGYSTSKSKEAMEEMNKRWKEYQEYLKRKQLKPQ